MIDFITILSSLPPGTTLEITHRYDGKWRLIHSSPRDEEGRYTHDVYEGDTFMEILFGTEFDQDPIGKATER